MMLSLRWLLLHKHCALQVVGAAGSRQHLQRVLSHWCLLHCVNTHAPKAVPLVANGFYSRVKCESENYYGTKNKSRNKKL